MENGVVLLATFPAEGRCKEPSVAVAGHVLLRVERDFSVVAQFQGRDGLKNLTDGKGDDPGHAGAVQRYDQGLDGPAARRAVPSVVR